MRVIVFFDLPTVTAADRKAYVQFRKYLIKAGFCMEQESVYSKLAVNATSAEAISHNIRSNSPPKGIVQLMKVTEKQYTKMEYVVGKRSVDVLDSDERIIIL